MHTTIFAISESPKQKGVLWVGTDDGNVQITKDDGAHWTNVVKSVPGLPKNSWVSSIQASTHDAGTAYATFDRHTYGEMDPYAYVTTDFGAHWTALVTPKDRKTVKGYAHVLREDPEDADLLLPGHGARALDLDRPRPLLVAVHGSDFPAVAVRTSPSRRRRTRWSRHARSAASGSRRHPRAARAHARAPPAGLGAPRVPDEQTSKTYSLGA
jgi:hypothetical protein